MTRPAHRATWRTAPAEVADAVTLLDRGLDLLDGLADDPTPTLRWYRASTPAVVLGRGQADVAAAARALAAAPVITTRSSGGGAVLMDSHLLSLDVLLPTGHPWLDGDLGTVFERVGEVWAAALGDLGVQGLAVHRGAGTARRRGSARDRLLAAVCYATLGRGEVHAAGRKVVGLAQRRRRPGALVQCGLLRRWDPGALLAALGIDEADPDVLADVLGAATGVDDLLDDPPDDATIIAAVHRRFTGYSQGP